MIAIRQTAVSTGAASATTISTTLNVLADSTLHVCAACDYPPQILSCSDGINAYIPISGLNDAVNGKTAFEFAANNIGPGNLTVTVTINGASTNRCIAVREITGTDGFDEFSALQQDNPTTVADATTSNFSGANTAPFSMLSGFSVCTGGAGAPAAGTGFTDDGTPWGSISNCRFESQRAAVQGIGAAATFTAQADVTHLSFLATFSESQGTQLLGGYTL